ncbi:A/G-specific adenine glycosylase [Myroides odoratimimus]|uniref:A/G-specific adenine glycosylase n=1 Tax=Myroides odoratimimus TaxID=76832 RepID=UPI0025787ECB|nr:A/G-specific adenine glycosylase [Myroides odoratimimus]MDM1065177.1 A/G-specific adenine glycosylase [Myroides odoratimimus]
MRSILFTMIFSNKLITWYLENKRFLPWRETKNPYAIWLSEIILQQTRVAQGLPYFEAFLTTYPTVKDLADAPEDDVMRLWQGLGYYSRARNLHATAKKVAYELNGVFPPNYKELLTLKGVGEYTAAAIASIAYDEVVPVVDGNVFRVLSRVYGITSDISTNTTKKEFQALAATLIPQHDPATFNQAIMDFGAIQCTPKSPDCPSCPYIKECVAYQTNQVAVLPIKLSKVKVKKRYLDFIIFIDKDGNTHIEQRTAKDIWQQLYQFPVFDSFTHHVEDIDSALRERYDTLYIKEIKELTIDAIIHQLSHQKLHIKFWCVQIEATPSLQTSWEDLNKFGFPIVIHNFITSLVLKTLIS